VAEGWIPAIDGLDRGLSKHKALAQSIMAAIESGDLRALAVTTRERSPALPDVRPAPQAGCFVSRCRVSSTNHFSSGPRGADEVNGAGADQPKDRSSLPLTLQL
jgi:hypothetical protein